MSEGKYRAEDGAGELDRMIDEAGLDAHAQQMLPESLLSKPPTQRGGSLLPGQTASSAGQAKRDRELSLTDYYSEQLGKTTAELRRLPTRTLDPGSTGNTKVSFATDGACAKWSKTGRLVRTTFAIHRDLQDLKTMVGTKSKSSVASAEDTERQIHAELELQRGVIMPDTTVRIVWDVLQVILLLYVALVVPFRFGFNFPAQLWSGAWWFELCVDVYFIVDVVLNFFFAFEDAEEMKVIVDRTLIRKKYLKGWFVVDVFSILPFSYVTQFQSSRRIQSGSQASPSSSGGNTKLLKILRMVRLAKLLRLSKVRRLVKKYSYDVAGLAATVRLTGTLAAALFIAHMYACAWYYFGDDPQGWVYAKYPKVNHSCPPSIEDVRPEDATATESDVVAASMFCVLGSESVANPATGAGASIAVQYLYTFWWSLSILLGSELISDLQPRTHGEVVFTMVAQIIGAVLFGMIIGTVGTLLMSNKLLEEKVDRQLAELREFMQEKKIPKSLRKRIREYMEQLYRAKTGYNAREVLEQLPPKLSAELLDSMYRETVLSVPLFRHLEHGCVRDICLAMKPCAVLRGEYVFKEYQLAREMYVIEGGQIQISKHGVVISTLSKNSFIGESALQQGRRFRQRTAIACEDSTLAMLSKSDCYLIAKDWPNLFIAFEEVGARKAKLEAIRMNGLLQGAAKELGVSVRSNAMQQVLSAVENLTMDTSASEEMQEQIRAAKTVQRFARGYLARKYTQTRRGIAEGVLSQTETGLGLTGEEADVVTTQVRLKRLENATSTSVWKREAVELVQHGKEQTPRLYKSAEARVAPVGAALGRSRGGGLRPTRSAPVASKKYSTAPDIAVTADQGQTTQAKGVFETTRPKLSIRRSKTWRGVMREHEVDDRASLICPKPSLEPNSNCSLAWTYLQLPQRTNSTLTRSRQSPTSQEKAILQSLFYLNSWLASTTRQTAVVLYMSLNLIVFSDRSCLIGVRIAETLAHENVTDQTTNIDSDDIATPRGTAKFLQNLDLNGDGMIDAEGYDTNQDGIIDALDTNFDGKIDTKLIGKGIDLQHNKTHTEPSSESATALRLLAIENSVGHQLKSVASSLQPFCCDNAVPCCFSSCVTGCACCNRMDVDWLQVSALVSGQQTVVARQLVVEKMLKSLTDMISATLNDTSK